jgi:hypothetical protein
MSKFLETLIFAEGYVRIILKKLYLQNEINSR